MLLILNCAFEVCGGVRVCAWAQVHIYACPCKGQRLTSGAIAQEPSTLLLVVNYYFICREGVHVCVCGGVCRSEDNFQDSSVLSCHGVFWGSNSGCLACVATAFTY